MLLHLSENRILLKSCGIVDSDIVCCDEFKSSIMTKSVFLPGFCTLVCNLFKTIGSTFGARMEALQGTGFKHWEKMYSSGLEKEIYELDLSKAYFGLTFGEAVLDIIHRTEGQVMLIGIVEYGGNTDVPLIKLNPGCSSKLAPWIYSVSDYFRIFWLLLLINSGTFCNLIASIVFKATTQIGK